MWAIHALKPLRSYVSSRVVLIGDAVRLCLRFSCRGRTHRPQGTCNDASSGRRCFAGDRGMIPSPEVSVLTHVSDSRYVQDAYILAALVNNLRCTIASVPDVLRIYDSIRQPFGNRVQAASRHQGQCYELNGPGFAHILPGDKSVTPETLRTLLQDLIKGWNWQWSCSAETDKEQALSKLCEIDFRRAG